MTEGLGFGGLLVVALIAVIAPLVARAIGHVQIPGRRARDRRRDRRRPLGARLVEVDQPIAVLALVGLAFLLFLAGLEIDLHLLRGDLLRLPLIGFACTLVLGLVAGFGFDAVGWVSRPLFVAVAISATSLGLVVPVLKDAAPCWAWSIATPQTTHLRLKLDAVGYGFLIPAFFVSSGLRFDLEALTESPTALARVQLFLLALLVVRGAPALLYRPRLGEDGARIAGLLQATSLPFIVTAAEIGVSVGAIARVTAAALVSAGLVSVVVFPPLALARLRALAGDRDAGALRPSPSPTAMRQRNGATSIWTEGS